MSGWAPELRADLARVLASLGMDGDTGALQAKVLTVSDGVVAGTRLDRSGEALEQRLGVAGFDVVDRSVVADGVDTVAGALLQSTCPRRTKLIAWRTW